MNDKIFLILFSSLAILCEAIIVHDHYGKDHSANHQRRLLYGDNHVPVHQQKMSSSEETTRNANGMLNLHEVDAFGDDFVDFGAQTGPYGAFTWHANFPVEEKR
uniref:Uncharacterized protein n=1 Tax=Anopheles epiroticus TaxID=199890 RepID=A0A182P2B6_9DIPT